jgi:hypothetical protein
MAVDWHEIRRRFDPLEPPNLGDIDRIYVRRPEGLTSNLSEYLTPKLAPRICLLLGQRSSGKTTELLRTTLDLQAYYLVVVVNLSEILPGEFGILDVLFALGGALYRTAEEVAPGTVERRLYTDLLAGMGESVKKWVEKNETGLSVPALAKSLAVLVTGFFAGSKAAETLGKAADKAIEALSLKQSEVTEIERRFKDSPRLAEMLRCLRAIIEALENRVAQRPLLLLADGLDLFPPEQTRAVAQREDILSALPCRAVFVAPPDLEIALEAPTLQKVERVRLPNLPVTGLDGSGDLPDTTLRFFDDLFSRRLPQGLSRTAILDNEQLVRLTRMSGGVIRDFVRMVSEACGAAARQSKRSLDGDCVEHGIAELAQSMGARARQEGIRDVLRRVATEHILPAAAKVNGLDLIHHNLVLLYRQGRHTWFDVHPVIKEVISG